MNINRNLNYYCLIFLAVCSCLFSAKHLDAAAPPTAQAHTTPECTLVLADKEDGLALDFILDLDRASHAFFSGNSQLLDDKMPAENEGKETAAQLLQKIDSQMTEGHYGADVALKACHLGIDRRFYLTLHVTEIIGLASPVITMRIPYFSTLLHMPLEESAALVRKLVRHGAPVEGHPDIQYTPLMYAVLMNNIPVTRALLDCGASVTAKSKTPGTKTAPELAKLLGHNDIAHVMAGEITRREMGTFILGNHPTVGEGSPVSLLRATGVAQEIAQHLLASYKEDLLPTQEHTAMEDEGPAQAPTELIEIERNLRALEFNLQLSHTVSRFFSERFAELSHAMPVEGETTVQLLQKLSDLITEDLDINNVILRAYCDMAPLRLEPFALHALGVASPEIIIRTPFLADLLWIPLEESAAIVRKLLQRGMPLEGHPEDQCTPLMCAVLKNNLPVAEALLDYGASISAKSKTPDAKTALELATLLGHKDIARAIAHEELQRNNLRKVTRHEMQAFTLGMHPRVGEESPVSLTSDPNIAHEIALHLLASYRQDPLPAPAHAQLIAQMSPGFVGGLWSSIGTVASYVPGSSAVAALWRSIKPPRK